mmetsp:Transcript_9753/g.16160  ORF Transcript_9753/g.16160 Transcript_9753/m.16160 type:complete len:271 (-) Transcript_9753:73-885(-)|eukprot:CAMPEP_0181024562 /NCGR_PEP_ID=MMETSP1070-20121207/2642_1 /TAXON_ID=265543 /ORGANISM="Minutocellus polymorphus, Strain NH13" /LENGTH=270 /DNA_ID=CAMNT_0023101635 /DNA_START=113 /DNA_END=925 /DNA_ORIENTATION=-
MGCVSSTAREPRAPPVSHIPTQDELTKKFELVKGEPVIQHTFPKTEEIILSSDQQVTFHVDKSSKSHTGATFIVYDNEPDEDGNRKTWNKLFVQGCKFGLGPRKRLENMTGIFQGGEETPPLSYWVCDASKGPNNFMILQDTKRSETQKPTHFQAKDRRSLYLYATVDYNLETTVCSVTIMGQVLYQMRQANPETWIVYRRMKKHDGETSYDPCALFAQSKGSGGYPLGRYPRYDVTISPGLDPLLMLHFCTMTDYFYEEFLRKTKTRYY